MVGKTEVKCSGSLIIPWYRVKIEYCAQCRWIMSSSLDGRNGHYFQISVSSGYCSLKIFWWLFPETQVVLSHTSTDNTPAVCDTYPRGPFCLPLELFPGGSLLFRSSPGKPMLPWSPETFRSDSSTHIMCWALPQFPSLCFSLGTLYIQ